MEALEQRVSKKGTMDQGKGKFSEPFKEIRGNGFCRGNA